MPSPVREAGTPWHASRTGVDYSYLMATVVVPTVVYVLMPQLLRYGERLVKE